MPRDIRPVQMSRNTPKVEKAQKREEDIYFFSNWFIPPLAWKRGKKNKNKISDTQPL